MIGIDSIEAERRVPFFCPNGHDRLVAFDSDDDAPAMVPCNDCAAMATQTPAGLPATVSAATLRGDRTHWEAVAERRTSSQLEALLAERLAARGPERGAA